MIDLRKEADLGRSHRVVVWQKQLKPKDTSCIGVSWNPPMNFYIGTPTFVRRLRGSMDRDVEISQIIFMRHSIDSRDPVSIPSVSKSS